MHLGRPKPIGKIAILRCALQPLCTKWTLNVSTIDTSHPDAGKSAQDHTTLLENTTPLMNTNNSAKYLLLFVFTHHLPRFLFAHRLDTPACTSTPGLFHLTCLSLVHDLSLWNDLLTTHVSFSNRNQHNRSLEIIYFGISIPGPSKGCPGWRSLSGGLGRNQPGHPLGRSWYFIIISSFSFLIILLDAAMTSPCSLSGQPSSSFVTTRYSCNRSQGSAATYTDHVGGFFSPFVSNHRPTTHHRSLYKSPPLPCPDWTVSRRSRLARS